MGAVVTFDYGVWVARYPEFSTVDPLTVAQYASEATSSYHRNDPCNPVCDPAQQLSLINMVVAHIAALNAGINGQAPTTAVGRVSSASQGSVSVSLELQAGTSTLAQYFAQTKYGLAYWAAMSPFRTMRYRPGPRRVFNPWYRGGVVY
jgi:Protein of unknown function (DUF4054)